MNDLTKKVVRAASEEVEKAKKTVSTQITGNQNSAPGQSEPINWYPDIKELSDEEERKIRMQGLQREKELENEMLKIFQQKASAQAERLAQPMAPQIQREDSAPAMPSSPSRRKIARSGSHKSAATQAELPKKIT